MSPGRPENLSARRTHDHRLPRPLHHRPGRTARRIGDAQIAHFEDPSNPEPELNGDQRRRIRETIEKNQLKALKERGADMTIFSPKRQRRWRTMSATRRSRRSGRGSATT